MPSWEQISLSMALQHYDSFRASACKERQENKRDVAFVFCGLLGPFKATVLKVLEVGHPDAGAFERVEQRQADQTSLLSVLPLAVASSSSRHPLFSSSSCDGLQPTEETGAVADRGHAVFHPSAMWSFCLFFSSVYRPHHPFISSHISLLS